MATDSIVLTTNEAKIILDWDDGQWYVSDIDYSSGGSSSGSSSSSSDTSSGVKVPEWDELYKYTTNDIIAYEGILYVSKQNQNQGNQPDDGSFWWNTVVDYENIDATTIEGKNFTEIVRDVLGGNLISDYYKKTEVNNLILTYFNNVNAKKLEGWTLEEIQTDYESKINDYAESSEQFTITYLSNDGANSFDQSLVDVFNASIADDNTNQI